MSIVKLYKNKNNSIFGLAKFNISVEQLINTYILLMIDTKDGGNKIMYVIHAMKIEIEPLF